MTTTKRFQNWLRGEQVQSLTHMKWAFLLMVGLSIYSFIGTSAETATAPLASLLWMVGIALFLVATVNAFRHMGARVVGQYVSGVHGVRRVLLFAVLLWATSIAGAKLARFFVGMMRDNTVLDHGCLLRPAFARA